jgi:hypothetical protein
MTTDPDGKPYRHNDEQSEAHKEAFMRRNTIRTPGFWRRVMCRLSLCGGYVDHEKDAAGVWQCGLRCATCGKLKYPVKSRFQDSA